MKLEFFHDDDIILTYSKTKMTPKHIGLGIMVHQQTKSKKVVEVLHQCGHSVSYKDVLRIRNSIDQEKIMKYIKSDFISLTFRGTQMVAFQQGPANLEKTAINYELLSYKAKLDLPQNFHLLRHGNFNTSIKPAPIIKDKETFFN